MKKPKKVKQVKQKKHDLIKINEFSLKMLRDKQEEHAQKLMSLGSLLFKFMNLPDVRTLAAEIRESEREFVIMCENVAVKHGVKRSGFSKWALNLDEGVLRKKAGD